jgi:hypothetical protein
LGLAGGCGFGGQFLGGRGAEEGLGAGYAEVVGRCGWRGFGV